LAYKESIKNGQQLSWPAARVMMMMAGRFGFVTCLDQVLELTTAQPLKNTPQAFEWCVYLFEDHERSFWAENTVLVWKGHLECQRAPCQRLRDPVTALISANFQTNLPKSK
jgi:hypothetical protein